MVLICVDSGLQELHAVNVSEIWICPLFLDQIHIILQHGRGQRPVQSWFFSSFICIIQPTVYLSKLFVRPISLKVNKTILYHSQADERFDVVLSPIKQTAVGPVRILVLPRACGVCDGGIQVLGILCCTVHDERVFFNLNYKN